MRVTRNKKAFTIVELIIVIAVIGVLAAILIPTFTGVIQKANEKSAYSDAKNQLTSYITELEGDGTDGADIMADTVFVVHKAGKLYFFQYSTSMGKLEQATTEPVPFDADPKSADYSELVDIAANTAITDLVYRGEMMGAAQQLPRTSNVDDHKLSNVKLYKGVLEQDVAKIGTYFSTITPLATLQSQQTTVRNSEGATVSAISLKTERDLYSFSNYINNGSLPNTTNAKLEKDMFMGGVEWTPIGEYYATDFAGTFDGNGYTVYDLHSAGVVDLPFQFGGQTIDFGGCALFGATTKDADDTKALIKNLNVVNVTSDTSPAAAALAIYGFDTVVENVHVYGDLKAPSNIGGLFWYAAAVTMRNCIVEADITSSADDRSTLAGGYVAQSSGDLQFLNCEYSGIIKQTDAAMTKKCYAGFIVGYCYEYYNYFQNFTVGLNSKIIGNPTDAAFTGEDFEGNPVTNNVPLLRQSDGTVYATGTNLFGYRAYVSGTQEVRLYNLGI